MPVQGKKVAAAVSLAAATLAPKPVAGTILVVADDLGGADAGGDAQAAGRNGVLILAVAPPQADRADRSRAAVDRPCR